jgi:hypothetical protein
MSSETLVARVASQEAIYVSMCQASPGSFTRIQGSFTPARPLCLMETAGAMRTDGSFASARQGLCYELEGAKDQHV